MNTPDRRLAPPSKWLLIAAGLLLVPGCITPVPFHERRVHADPLMALSENPTESHWYGKVIHSMEGSIGAVGANGGGGCGCY